MTTYQFYLSDDALPMFTEGPLRNEDIITDSALRHILKDGKLEWSEPPVKDLLQTAVKNPEWKVSAARNPEFFLKAFDTSLDKPDLLVFDWDYPGLTKSSEEFLMEFLERTYCLVRIYTGVEKIEEVQAILKKDRFAPYSLRITISEKNKVDADALLKEVQAKRESNFSYKFGAELRKTTLESLEKILISLGRISIDQVMALLNAAGTTEGDFKEILVEKLRNHLREDKELVKFLMEKNVDSGNAHALIDLIAEKVRNELNSTEIKFIPLNLGGVSADDPEVAEAAANLWSYRLYHRPSDDNVRRGDVVKRIADGKFFVVVSADCDLNRLWRKNYGHVNLVPALQFKKDSPILQERFRLGKIKANAVFKTKSLTENLPDFPEGVLLLPFVPVNGAFFNFLVLPKELTSVELPAPAGADTVDKIRECCLFYQCFPGFERVCTISEPFLTPFAHTLLEAVSGLGVPDYPAPVKNAIHDRSKKSLA